MNKFRFDTGNAIESENLRDFTDNLKNADLRLNSEEFTFIDRFGVERATIAGEEESFNEAHEERVSEFSIEQSSRTTAFNEANILKDTAFNDDQTDRENQFNQAQSRRTLQFGNTQSLKTTEFNNAQTDRTNTFNTLKDAFTDLSVLLDQVVHSEDPTWTDLLSVVRPTLKGLEQAFNDRINDPMVGKVDVIPAHSLVADTEIDRLASVDNFDNTDNEGRLDTIEGLLISIQSRLDDLEAANP